MNDSKFHIEKAVISRQSAISNTQVRSHKYKVTEESSPTIFTNELNIIELNKPSHFTKVEPQLNYVDRFLIKKHASGEETEACLNIMESRFRNTTKGQAVSLTFNVGNQGVVRETEDPRYYEIRLVAKYYE